MEPLRSSQWGFLAVDMKGDTLVSINPGRRLVPASNLKLITTGTALMSLGAAYTFHTDIAYSGQISDGTLEGDVFVIGGGDPTIGRLFDYLPWPENHFRKWHDALQRSGIRRVEGNIVGDGSWFDAPLSHGDWGREDYETRDGVVPSGLTYRGRMRDTIPDGPYSCALHFREYLLSRSFPVSGVPLEHKADSNCVRIASFPSPPLYELIRTANYESDNFIAETLLKAMGLKFRGSSEYDEAIAAMQGALAPLGLRSRSFKMQFADGSGLSRKNFVTPDFLVSFLCAMARQDCFDAYLHSLPFPGEGTLKPRLRHASPSVKERIFMKSGSMNGVRCFSGYIVSSDGDPSKTIVFSLMASNLVSAGSAFADSLDSLIVLLAGEN